jgi:integrase
LGVLWLGRAKIPPNSLKEAVVLTNMEVRNAQPKEKAYKKGDARGLFLFVTPSGGKLWRWKYKKDGKEKLMALGKYPDVSLAQAREQLEVERKMLAGGGDPMAQRRATKTSAENSFGTVAAKWLDHWLVGKSPRHVAYVRRRLKADILPKLGTRPIAEIEAPEIVIMAKSIEDRGAGDLAKRALQTTVQIFRYAIAHGYARQNPASDIKPSDILKATRKRNYARVGVKDLPELLRAIEVYQGTPITRLAIKLMAMTFVRTSELIGASWKEFDLNAARWDIPATRMKMRSPHIVPLATQSLEVLSMLRTLSGDSDWLFPGDRDRKKSMSNNTILKALERMKYKGKMTGHGFRGLASTVLHEKGYPHEHIELQLAHMPRNSVSAAYNHALYLEPRATMMQEWADFLETTLRGRKMTPKPSVTLG